MLDEETGDVITLRELLKKTLYRASAKMLESSVPASPRPLLTPNAIESEDEEDEDDDDEAVQVFGTDGQMKDRGGGKFVVVKGKKQVKSSRFDAAKRKLQDDQDLVDHAEKKLRFPKEMEIVHEEVCELVPDTREPADESTSVSVVEVIKSEELDKGMLLLCCWSTLSDSSQQRWSVHREVSKKVLSRPALTRLPRPLRRLAREPLRPRSLRRGSARLKNLSLRNTQRRRFVSRLSRTCVRERWR